MANNEGVELSDLAKITLHVRDVTPHELETKSDDLDVTFEDQLDNVDPVTGAVIIAGALVAGKFLLRLWREYHGGTVIDLTRSPVDISRNGNLPYGFFMVIAKDGSVTVDPKDEPTDALERMATAVLKLGVDATVGALKEAVDDALTDKAKVEDATE